MSRKRAPMRRIKEVLRLLNIADLSERDIGTATNQSKTTVHDYKVRAQLSGLSWAEAMTMDDTTIELRLFPESGLEKRLRPLPDWGTIHQELRRKGVTLQLLWEEYLGVHPDGYGYSRFCELYQKVEPTFDLSMRQAHKAGEKVFVDYSGQTIDIVDRKTGECRPAQIFVAVWGASNYTYVEATWSQKLCDWTGSHVRAFQFFGGCPEILVPDNLRSGVTKAWFYDPEINPTYQRLASHYGVAVIPTRAARPKDKAKVEVGVQVVQRWILACLRHQTFFTLVEANAAIEALLERLNNRRFRKLPGTRRSQFESLDKPLLRPLPATPYEFDEWKKTPVGIDYHVEWDDHNYSVPYQLAKQVVDMRITASVVEIFSNGKRVAAHPRNRNKYTFTTLPEHMPASHRKHMEWNPQRIIQWAGKAGNNVAAYVERLMNTRPHPEQGFKCSLGIIRLAKKVGDARLDAACLRALTIGGNNYRCVANILERGLDRIALPEKSPALPVIKHENVRGPGYYKDDNEIGGTDHAESTHH